MKNKIETVKNSWTWNHKMLIVNLSLVVVVVFQAELITFPEIKASEPIVYTQKVESTEVTIQQKLERRAKEMYQENEQIDLEQYRQKAIREMNEELIVLIGDSPFIDYKELSEKYGY